MAGIGFTLKKLFSDDIYTKRLRAYFYTAFVAAGPWISAIITMNVMLFVSKIYNDNYLDRELVMGCIVYGFIFSQIITAPFQLIITRYVSDQLYSKKYSNIRASFRGVNNIVACLSMIGSLAYYWKKDISLQFKFLAIALFVVISLLWILMVYLSTIKNYIIISLAYVIGGVVTIALVFVTAYYPIHFEAYSNVCNLIFCYLIGIIVTYIILLYSFIRAFPSDSNLQYDFLRYFDIYPSLAFIGFFYNSGIWIDNVIIWNFSDLKRNVFNVYKFAPLYDNAIFLSYLTIIPTMMLFIISVETEFYNQYKEYYGLASENGTLKELKEKLNILVMSLSRQLTFTFETQTLISLFIIVISGPLFVWFDGSVLVKDIFKITTLGALCNIFVLIIILVLLYFEARVQASVVTFIFFFLNGVLTFMFKDMGESLYGIGFFISALVALIIGIVVFGKFIKALNYITFCKTPLVQPEKKGLFINLAHVLKGSNEE